MLTENLIKCWSFELAFIFCNVVFLFGTSDTSKYVNKGAYIMLTKKAFNTEHFCKEISCSWSAFIGT